MAGLLSPYVNHGRWIADCPECNGGIPCELEQAVLTCPDCRAMHQAKWPERAAIVAALKVLATRPTENRNWYPEKENTLDLKAENALRGLAF